MNALQELLDFLTELEKRHIDFSLSRVRPEAIMVEIAVPGEQWEVEFFADGHIEVEVFDRSTGVQGKEALDRLFAEFTD
jgi:hypothetical protein